MQTSWKSLFRQGAQFTWPAARDYFFITLGALLQALAIRLFLVPAHLVSGGVSGLAQLINFYTGWPIGLMIFIGNLPLFLLGWRYLGGPRFVFRTAFAVVAVSAFTDSLLFVLPKDGLTKDLVLNTLYGGIISGIGYGLVYQGQGTSGGTDILVRILNHWRGMALSASYLMTDSLVILLAGLVFGWTNALYALVLLYISGVAAETVMGGSTILRTAVIITNRPKEVGAGILQDMERGITVFHGEGGYTGEERTVLYCVVSRSEINQLKTVVREADPKAFMVIGHAAEALGEGFIPLDRS